MPVRVVCPECGATTSLPDEFQKKTVECRQCGKELPVPGAKSAGPPPLPGKSGPPKLPKADAGFEILEDEDVRFSTPTPAQMRRIDEDLSDDTPRSGTVNDQDGEEDDDSGERARRMEAARARLRGEDPNENDDPLPGRRNQIDEDDDEQDDDYRSNRRPPAGKSSKVKLFVAVGLLAFLFVGGVGGAIVYYFWLRTGPVVAQTNEIPPVTGNPDNIPDLPPGSGSKEVNPNPIEPKAKDPKPKDTPSIETKAKKPKPVEPKPKDALPIDSKSKEPKSPVLAASAKLVSPAKSKLAIEPAMMSAPHVEVNLPGAIRDVCVGGGGRFLIFHLPTQRKLAIFDTSSLKIVKTITLGADEVLFAAGMNKLMVVYPEEKLVTRWDLSSFKLEMDVTLATAQKPTVVAMGSATDGPLVLAGIPAQGDPSKMGLRFLDQLTLTDVRIDKADGDFRVVFYSPAHLRVSADGGTIGAWYAQLQPTGLQIARLQGNSVSGSYLGESVGHVTPGPQSLSVFTGKGTFDTNAKPKGESAAAVPAVHGRAGLTLVGDSGAKQQVTAWDARWDKPQTFDDLPGFDGQRDPFERDNPNLTLDKRLFLVPDAKVLVVIPPAADKLHVYRVDGK